ncbi:MAG: GNAT family N-acetyltransferase [Thermoleophilaceae bacterium]|nr:GNAT family N-acetyltransferase [Thermoleophilaceae bacterium]
MRTLEPGDQEAVVAAGPLFDRPPDAEATRRFLSEPTHHLLMAYDSAGAPVGFVSGVETSHPDKGTEMFLYELSVDAAARRRGVGRRLVEALTELARGIGCYGLWVLADDDSAPARATYARAGGREASRPVMIEWEFGS